MIPRHAIVALLLLLALAALPWPAVAHAEGATAVPQPPGPALGYLFRPPSGVEDIYPASMSPPARPPNDADIPSKVVVVVHDNCGRPGQPCCIATFPMFGFTAGHCFATDCQVLQAVPTCAESGGCTGVKVGGLCIAVSSGLPVR